MKLTINGEVIPLSDESCGNKLTILGCVFCPCTLGLSWMPMCVWCCNMKSKYKEEAAVAAAAPTTEVVPHHQRDNQGGNDDSHQNNNNHPAYGVGNPTYNNGPVYRGGNTYNNNPVYGVPMSTSNNNNNDDTQKKNCGEARCAAGPVCTPPRSPKQLVTKHQRRTITTEEKKKMQATASVLEHNTRRSFLRGFFLRWLHLTNEKAL